MTNWFEKIKKAWHRASGDDADSVPIRAEGNQSERLADRALRTPPVDVFENDDELLLVADVPGATRTSTKIYWSDKAGLEVYAQAEADRTTASGNGGAPADWYRAFQLPDSFDPQEAQATVREGVLRVAIPRRPHTKPVAIPVRAG